MKLHYILPFIALFLACSEKKPSPIKNKFHTKDSIVTIEKTDVIVQETETDCVFDDKPYELTKDWLSELGFKKFTWDKKNTKAIVIQNQDTILVYKGGCNHLMSSIEINIEKDTDILQKISEIACTFKFENYCKQILTNQFEKIDSENNSYILEFEDDDPDDNLIYNGIEIKEQDKMVHVTISEYYN